MADGPAVEILGVRHHGPGSARSVARAGLDELHADARGLVDTTPNGPRPTNALVTAAAMAAPEILADIPPADGTIEMCAATLCTRLLRARERRTSDDAAAAGFALGLCPWN